MLRFFGFTRSRILSALFLTGALVGVAHWQPVQAQVVFDNGSYSGGQVGRFDAGSWTIFEDFTLSDPATVTGFTFTQHDQPVNYTSTDVSVFNGQPSPATLLFSDTVVAARTPNASGTLFGNYSGYDYGISGLSLDLAAGTYFFGIHNNVTGGQTTWDQTLGTSQTIQDRYQSSSPLSPGSLIRNENSAFQVQAASAVPEPGSVAMFVGMGITGSLFALRLRRRK